MSQECIGTAQLLVFAYSPPQAFLPILFQDPSKVIHRQCIFNGTWINFDSTRIKVRSGNLQFQSTGNRIIIKVTFFLSELCITVLVVKPHFARYSHPHQLVFDTLTGTILTLSRILLVCNVRKMTNGLDRANLNKRKTLNYTPLCQQHQVSPLITNVRTVLDLYLPNLSKVYNPKGSLLNCN